MPDPATALPEEIFHLIISKNLSTLGLFRRVSKTWNGRLTNEKILTTLQNPLLKTYFNKQAQWLTDNKVHVIYAEIEAFHAESFKVIKYGDNSLAVTKLKKLILSKIIELNDLCEDDQHQHREKKIAMKDVLINYLNILGIQIANCEEFITRIEQFRPEFILKDYAVELFLGNNLQQKAAIYLHLAESMIESYMSAKEGEYKEATDIVSVEQIKASYLFAFYVDRENAMKSYDSNVKPDSPFEIKPEDMNNEEIRDTISGLLAEQPDLLKEIEINNWVLPTASFELRTDLSFK